ncbi:MAG TPA: YceI family protein [Fimbriimonas sp.]
MKLRTAVLPLLAVCLGASYVALHPGVALAEPRFSGGATAQANTTTAYTIDPMHAGIYFEITHLGLSKVTGRFNKFSGKIVEDDKDLTKSSVEFTAQVDSIDTAVAPRDEHLRTADFFEVAKYPTLSFKSTKVEKSGDRYVVTGDLTIKGKTKSVAIPFTHHGPYTMEMGETVTRIGVMAEPITLKRSDFGVGSQDKLPDGTVGASDEVTVRISFEAIKDKPAS